MYVFRRFRVMRVSIAVFEAPEKTMEFHRRWDSMHVLTDSTSPREDMGCTIDFRFSCELSSYAIWPRGTSGRGTRVHFVNAVGHEMVSLPAPPVRNGVL